MANVTAFEIEGVKLWFWSDDHEPPHFHAKKRGEWEARVWFLFAPNKMIEIIWSEKRPAANTIKALRDLAEKHRVELFDQWSEVHGN